MSIYSQAFQGSLVSGVIYKITYRKTSNKLSASNKSRPLIGAGVKACLNFLPPGRLLESSVKLLISAGLK